MGDIVFAPDLSAEIFEKWVGFLAIVGAVLGLMLLTSVVAYTAAGSTLGSLQALSAGLTRMRQGHYNHLIPPTGPPEIRRSCEEANELASTLETLSRDNRNLLRQMVSLQDDERRQIARDLHDELGPLLFGIRANAVAVLETIPPDDEKLAAPTLGILQSVEALQQANRRILDHLRPFYFDELGLERSIQTLVSKARSQAPEIEFATDIDPRLNTIDGPLSQTVYRVIQEGVTNVLRHAKASSVTIEAIIYGEELAVADCGRRRRLPRQRAVRPGPDRDAGARARAERNVQTVARGRQDHRPLPAAGFLSQDRLIERGEALYPTLRLPG